MPAWLRATHALDILLLSLLARSGLQVFAAFPELYRSEHCPPGREWLRFTRRGPEREPGLVILTGTVYVMLLVATGQWRRLVPTSWSILPDAARALGDYLTFRLPPEGHPHNALQQLSYFGSTAGGARATRSTRRSARGRGAPVAGGSRRPTGAANWTPACC